MSRAARPAADPVLATLKDFQRDTVEHVFQRMFLDRPGRHRFLVADEVGLGKTLVARGVIAKAVEHLWEAVDRIDVVYICSNADIARQNINRLRIPGASEFTLASRLTMLPVQVRDLQHSRLNFISLTPGTSFDPKSKMGRWQERALLYLLLRKPWKLRGTAPLNLFQGHKSADKFRAAVKAFEQEKTVDATLAEQFEAELARHPDLRELARDLLQRFKYRRKHVPEEDIRDRRLLIGELRSHLAATCVEALEPDLVILDEFQRFKDLLDQDSDAALLAQRLFDWSRGTERARVLLLSATPYKMYTQAHERDTDDHYQDFLRTLRFLAPEEGAVERFDSVLREYRGNMYRLGDGDGSMIEKTKVEFELLLRDVMVRTERLAVSGDRNGMLTDATLGGIDLEPADVGTYRSLSHLATCLEHPDPVEFWKSAPYLLSFMEGYELKKRLVRRRADRAVTGEMARILSPAAGLSLSWEDVEAYDDIDPRNARLRWLLERTVGRGLWRFLWVPPSLPYYRPSSVWQGPGLAAFSKLLVFSSWRVVPRMLAAMVSYAAERETVTALRGRRISWSDLRERLRGPLRFNVRDGRPAGMSAIALMYPSWALSDLLDPLSGVGQDRDLRDVRRDAVGAAKHALAQSNWHSGSGPEDERWYWAAPILLDVSHDPKASSVFWADEDLPQQWMGGVAEPDDKGWPAHVGLVREILEDPGQLGAMPQDLPEVLADLTLGAPGILALRSLRRIGSPATLAERVIARREAAAIGWAARNLFNLAETVALIRGIDGSEPYWRRVAEYCAAGNLQAVLDEFMHVLVEALGITDWSSRHVMAAVGEQVREALSLRTSNPGFDVVKSRGGAIHVDSHRSRARFAHRFGDERAEGDDERGMRSDQVRHAFNSPFWPFVLATTSVGQEGLDFHQYCHAVVHWNLPSNPVDLEQREGRVHRYKGHAVRKTVAARYGEAVTDTNGGDPWAVLFRAAAAQREGGSELVPYWVHDDPDGVRIERHVPVLPLSRDVLRYERLRQSLALYRMVFGQPRQEDLVAYLAERLSIEGARDKLDALRIDLTPPRTARRLAPPSVPEEPIRGVAEASGTIGKAIRDVLASYPLVLGRKDARRDHPIAELLVAVGRALDAAGLAEGDRCGWEAECAHGRRWLPVPFIWLWDDRPHVRKHDDVMAQVLIDPERDGVQVALALAILDDGRDHWVPLQTAREYRDRRRQDLAPVLEDLSRNGFTPVPASEYLRGSASERTNAVALSALFLPRASMGTDRPIREALTRVMSAYDVAYEMRVATPEPAVRRLLR